MGSFMNFMADLAAKMNRRKKGLVMLEMPSGNVYEGSVVDGRPHGRGTMKYKNGRIYDGDWENGERHGEGTKKYASGTIHEGEWLNGKCHGQGRRQLANGNIYEGGWKDGSMHGNGTYKWADGSVYEGEHVKGKLHGTGTLKWANGAFYIGEFANDERNGLGVLTRPNGVKYAQKWEHDEILFNQRMVVLSDGPPSKIPWLEEHKSCQICLEHFASDVNGDEAARMRLPVLGACGHSCCYGCVLKQQASVARANSGTVPESINCFWCRDSGQGRGAFRPGEPTFNTMLIDLLARAFPA